MTKEDFNPFESLNPQSKDKARNGYEAGTIAETVYNVVRAVAHETNNWKNLTEIDREPWLAMASIAITVFDIKETEELRISVIEWAKNLWNALCSARSLDFPWEELTDLEKFAWQAAVRHVGNLIDSDGPQVLPLDEAEERVLSWARDRVEAGKIVPEFSV